MMTDQNKGEINEIPTDDKGGKVGQVAFAESNERQFDQVSNSNSVGTYESADEPKLTNVPEVPMPKSPNRAQKQAIEAPVSANLRVLAAPGSGKTYIIEHRYKYLIDNGVNPDNVLVCTYSKAMADEMGKRIQETCSVAIPEQVSTIHAFCYRLLTRWQSDSKYFGWKVPKQWQVKKFLEDNIGQLWQEKDKPSASEVQIYIDSSKGLGLSADDSYEWFVDQLNPAYGEWLYELRSRFDAWLIRNRTMTYADMLYLVEERLQADEEWRTQLQEKFSHIIIDEAQDTNYQAMRILITVSLEPGENTVYEMEKLE